MALDIIANETWDDVDKAWDAFTLETWDGWIEFSYALKVYDTSGAKVAEITGDLKNPTLTDLEFETLQQGGCGAFSFTLAEPYTQATISYNYKVEIYVFNPQVLFFTGKIINKPIEGTDKPQTYSGWGYFNELEKKIIDTEISPGSDIAVEVTSVLDTYITPYTSIVKDATLITTVSHDLVATIDFEDEYANEIFKRLTELAVDYKFGVNEDLKFYFQAIDTSVNYYWHIGKHLTEFNPQEDPSDIVKKVIAVYPEVFTDGYRLKVTSEAVGYANLYDKRFSLPEIVNPFSSTDIASGITPTTNPAVGTPANMTDGDYSTLWESGTNQASGHYIIIDLTTDFENIAAVVIDSIHANAKEYCAKSVKIEVKPDGGSYSTMLSSDDNIGWKPTITFRPTTGRYVKISLTGSSSEELKVGEVEIYQLDLTDAQRWADWKLSTLENVKKRATAKISNIQDLIMNSAGLVPIKPAGKARIFDRNGTKIDDYQVIACKYRLSSGGFLLDLELGAEEVSVADKDKEWQRRIRELENSGVRRAKNLSLAKGFQLSQIKGTYIGENEVQTKHVAAKTIIANQINVPGLDESGDIVIEDGVITAPKLNVPGLDESGDIVIEDGVITAPKLNITDLVNIANLLTVASGRIVIGANALGADKPGIVINDGTYNRIEAGKQNGDYGMTFRDVNGVLFSDLGKLQQIWVKVHDEYLTSNYTDYTVSGLDGDNDQIYYIIGTFINNAGVGCGFQMRLNNDSGNNYGRRYIYVDEANNVFGGNYSGISSWYMGDADPGKVTSTFQVVEAKSGTYRTAIGFTGLGMSGSSVDRASILSQVWSNTASNIISIKFLATQNNGIKAGSHVSIYKIPAYT